jgi:hypothetical protein
VSLKEAECETLPNSEEWEKELATGTITAATIRTDKKYENVTIDFRANIRIGNLKNSCGFSNRNYQ